MKTFFITIPLLFLLSNCQQSPRSNVSTDKNVDLNIKTAVSKYDTTPGVFIKDSLDYSPTFIKSIQPSKPYYKYNLEKNHLILNYRDTITFPEIIPLNNQIQFSGENNNIKIDLSVTRVSQSTIKYSFSVSTDSIASSVKSGFADLSPSFFLGSEQDEIDSTHFYSSIEYWDPNDKLLTSIRVGKDPRNKDILLAKIKCYLLPKKIDLKNCPILLEKHGSL